MTAESAITVETQKRIDLLFDADQREDVSQLLESECGMNLPFSKGMSALSLERIRFAALKLSDGDLDDLIRAIELAQTDWRDLLVAAGFEHDLNAHTRWLP